MLLMLLNSTLLNIMNTQDEGNIRGIKKKIYMTQKHVNKYNDTSNMVKHMWQLLVELNLSKARRSLMNAATFSDGVTLKMFLQLNLFLLVKEL